MAQGSDTTRADGRVDAALAIARREDGARVLALLARRFGELTSPQEAVEAALEQAERDWPRLGVPANPAGWLLATARRGLRASRSSGGAAGESGGAVTSIDLLELPDSRLLQAGRAIPDDRLWLLFLCCHPVLSGDEQLALTLHLVSGLDCAEIAAALPATESEVADRIAAAERAVVQTEVGRRVEEDELDSRVDAVLDTLFMIFTLGHRAEPSDLLGHADLTAEAVRLGATLDTLLPRRPDVLGLRALMSYHHARRDGHLEPAAELVLLADQDRERWRAAEIRSGNELLGRALQAGAPERYTLLAVAAGMHANAADASSTNWRAIRRAYDRLVELDPSPVVALNRAIAVWFVEGPEAGLALLDELRGLSGSLPWRVARAELLTALGQQREAATEWDAAESLADTAVRAKRIRERRAALTIAS